MNGLTQAMHAFCVRPVLRLNRPVLTLAFACAPVAIACPAPAQNVDACGTLIQGTECVLFESNEGGRFVLDDRGQFEVGDEVRVIGELDEGCVSVCQEGEGCIAVASITHCDGDVTICGTLVDGVTCLLLEDDQGFLLAIENQGPFEVGDRVQVNGQFDGGCVTVCQQVTGCVQDNTIRAAPADGPCDPPGSIICPAAGLALLGAGVFGLARFRAGV